MILTLQTFVDGKWLDAGDVEIPDAHLGHNGRSTFSYAPGYVATLDDSEIGTCIDARAIGATIPVKYELEKFASWPPPLLDLLPQGHARSVVRKALGKDSADGVADDLDLLLRAGGSPIGNIRVKQAAEEEAGRITEAAQLGLHGFTGEQIARHDNGFLEMATDFGAAVSGSSGVQGAWPKVLMTRNSDGLWYPDPLVPDDQATLHVIVKWAGNSRDESLRILDAEAPYLELARLFGLRVGRSLERTGNVLVIPRFDRVVGNGEVIRFGQESIVSATGIAAFGHMTTHEVYLDTIKRISSDPATDVREDVLRDVLNLALGNPDNHGRNTALLKTCDGRICLSPLFDFTPMRLSPDGITRSTKWGCMRRDGGGTLDIRPDWERVCEVAADGVPGLSAESLMDNLHSKAGLLRTLPDEARRLKIPEDVIELAMGRCGEIAADLEALDRKTGDAPEP